jgi:transposase
MRRYPLRDDQWDRMKDVSPGKPGDVGVTATESRLFVEAALYRYRARIPWRDLPERFGDFKAVHTRFTQWSEKRVWQKVFEILSQEADNAYAMIDATIVRAHQHSAGAKKRQRSSDWTVRWRSEHEDSCDLRRSWQSNWFSPHTRPNTRSGKGRCVDGSPREAGMVFADKAYDADERMRRKLKEKAREAVIPPKKNRLEPSHYDRNLYKSRHLIENFFAKLKQYGAIATRYDKTSVNFLGAIHLASIVVWLN